MIRKLHTGYGFIIWGMAIGQTGTLHFLEKYGWHYYAINGWEIFWDLVAMAFVITGACFLVKARRMHNKLMATTDELHVLVKKFVSEIY